jgi:hypothetical protein
MLLPYEYFLSMACLILPLMKSSKFLFSTYLISFFSVAEIKCLDTIFLSYKETNTFRLYFDILL